MKNMEIPFENLRWFSILLGCQYLKFNGHPCILIHLQREEIHLLITIVCKLSVASHSPPPKKCNVCMNQRSSRYSEYLI
jgi:hypothetical protein